MDTKFDKIDNMFATMKNKLDAYANAYAGASIISADMGALSMEHFKKEFRY